MKDRAIEISIEGYNKVLIPLTSITMVTYDEAETVKVYIGAEGYPKRLPKAEAEALYSKLKAEFLVI